MKTRGRPTGYRPDNAKWARICCELGATSDQLAEYFEVSPRTIDNWIVNFPEFGKAVREAKALGDETLWRSLFQRAKGYYYIEKRVVRDGDKEREETWTRYAKPDLRGWMIWFRNRAQWLEEAKKKGRDAGKELTSPPIGRIEMPPSDSIVTPDCPTTDHLPDTFGPDPAFLGLPPDDWEEDLVVSLTDSEAEAGLSETAPQSTGLRPLSEEEQEDVHSEDIRGARLLPGMRP